MYLDLDIWPAVIADLPPVVRLRVGMTCRAFKSLINPASAIKAELTAVLAVSAASFLEVMRQSNAVLSGSFLVWVFRRCWEKQLWIPGDLDLFIMSSVEDTQADRLMDYLEDRSVEYTPPPILKLLLNNGYTTTCSHNAGCMEMEGKTSLLRSRYNNLPAVSYKFSHDSPNCLSINLIVVDCRFVDETIDDAPMALRQWIDKYFDLSICKNSYDGTMLQLRAGDLVESKSTLVWRTPSLDQTPPSITLLSCDGQPRFDVHALMDRARFKPDRQLESRCRTYRRRGIDVRITYPE
jgi:hypothetical protein